MSIQNDKSLVRRAYTDRTPVGTALLASLTVAMAEARLATASWFWSDSRQTFTHVD